jgi:hypothetical protein
MYRLFRVTAYRYARRNLSWGSEVLDCGCQTAQGKASKDSLNMIFCIFQTFLLYSI